MAVWPKHCLLKWQRHCPRNFDALIPGSTMTRSNSSIFLWVLFDREGNGNPLQCSCLENPRDGGAWWAAVHGVAQSRTRLKQLSSGSSMNAKSLQLYPTLCDSMDCSLPDFPVHGILQAKILEWVAGPSFRGIFLAQGSSPCLLHLLHWQVDSLPPAPPGKPLFDSISCYLNELIKFLFVYLFILALMWYLGS